MFDDLDTHVTSTQLKSIFNGPNKQDQDVSTELEEINISIAQANRLGEEINDELKNRQAALQQIQHARNQTHVN